MAIKTLRNGDPVKVKDEYGVERDALVTACWSEKKEYDDSQPVHININVLFVSTDPKRTDQYGQQIERMCSVGHKSVAGECPGRFWWQS